MNLHWEGAARNLQFALKSKLGIGIKDALGVRAGPGGTDQEHWICRGFDAGGTALDSVVG